MIVEVDVKKPTSYWGNSIKMYPPAGMVTENFGKKVRENEEATTTGDGVGVKVKAFVLIAARKKRIKKR